MMLQLLRRAVRMVRPARPVAGYVLLLSCALLIGCNGGQSPPAAGDHATPQAGPARPTAAALPAPGADPSSLAAHPGQPAGRSVKLMLNWFPEMEHGGFYAAQVTGLFADAGLAVEIVPGGAGTPVVPALTGGRVDFGVMNADNLLLARGEGMPLVAVLAPIQTSPRCIIVHEASGITALDQLRDLTLAMNGTNAFAIYLQKHAPLTDVRVVPYSGNVAQFLLEPTFAQQGYVFSEPYLIRQQGGKPRALLLAEIGFNPYTSILVAREETLAKQPELVRALTRASRLGWERYFEKPQPANEAIHAANPQMALDVLAYGAETLRPMALTTGTQSMGLGSMSESRWATLTSQLEAIGMIKPGAVTPAAAFTNRFLE